MSACLDWVEKLSYLRFELRLPRPQRGVLTTIRMRLDNSQYHANIFQIQLLAMLFRSCKDKGKASHIYKVHTNDYGHTQPVCCRIAGLGTLCSSGHNPPGCFRVLIPSHGPGPGRVAAVNLIFKVDSETTWAALGK